MECPNDRCKAALDEVTAEIWRCPRCDEAWTATELEEARARGLAFSDLPELDVAAWPSFVAIPVDQWLEEEHPVQRLNRIADAGEVLVRYVCSIAVADLHERNGGRLPTDLREWLAPKVRRPTFGAWIAMVVELLEAADELDDSQRGPSHAFQRARTAFEEQILPLLHGESGDARPEEALLPLRNHIAHAGGVARKEGERLLREADHERRARETFRNLHDWLSSFVVHYVTDGGEFRQLRGVNARPVGAGPFSNELADRLDAYRGRAVLRDPQGELLDLTPLCGFGVPRVRLTSGDERSGDREVPEVYVRKETKALRYNPLGATESYSERRGLAVERFRRLFDVRTGRSSISVTHFGEELREDAQALVGRREELDRIVTAIKDAVREKHDGIFWLSGRAGTGKSMLMAAAAAHPKLGGGDDPELKGADPSSLLVVPWRFKTGDARNSLEAFLQFAVHRLQTTAPLSGETIEPDIDIPSADEANLESRFDDLLAAYAALEPRSTHPKARAPQVLFLLDGLDEIHRKDERVADLPFSHGRDNVIWLCAGRPEADLVERFEARDRVVKLFPANDGRLPPMSPDEIREMFETRLVGELGYDLRALDREHDDAGGITNPVVDAVVERADGLPMYVDLVIEDLNRGELDLETAVNDLPETVHDYYDDLLERYGLGDGGDLATRLLAILACAREPLTEATLHVLLADEGVVDAGDRGRSAVADALDVLGPMLRVIPTTSDDAGAPSYRLYHDSFRDHLATSDATAPLVEWAEQIFADTVFRLDRSSLEPLIDYFSRFALWHLVRAGRDEEAAELMLSVLDDETRWDDADGMRWFADLRRASSERTEDVLDALPDKIGTVPREVRRRVPHLLRSVIAEAGCMQPVLERIEPIREVLSRNSHGALAMVEGFLRQHTASIEEAEEAYRRGLTVDATPIETRAKLHLGLGKSFRVQGRFNEADDEFGQAVDLLAELGGSPGDHQLDARVQYEYAYLELVDGRYERAVERLRASAEDCRQEGDIRGEAYARGLMTRGLIRKGELEEAIHVGENVLLQARRNGFTRWRASLHGHQGLALTLAEALDDAESHLREAETLFRRMGSSNGVRSSLARLSRLYRWKGELPAAREAISQSSDTAIDGVHLEIDQVFETQKAATLLALERPSEALEGLKETWEIFEAYPVVHLRALARGLRCEAQLRSEGGVSNETLLESFSQDDLSYLSSQVKKRDLQSTITRLGHSI